MAKKTKKAKTTKQATPPSRNRAVMRRVTRARRWLDRIEQLDEWIDRDAKIHAMPWRRDLCEEEYRRRIAELGIDDATPTLDEFAKEGWALDEQFSLEMDLRLAATRLQLLAEYRPEQRAPIDEFQYRCFGRSDLKPPRAWRAKSDLAVFRRVIEAFRQLVDAEGVGRAIAAEKRKPSPLEAAILNELLDADQSLSSDDLASVVQRKHKISKPPKAIVAAIGKIRAECGMSDLKAKHGVGYKLTPEQVAIAMRLVGTK